MPQSLQKTDTPADISAGTSTTGTSTTGTSTAGNNADTASSGAEATNQVLGEATTQGLGEVAGPVTNQFAEQVPTVATTPPLPMDSAFSWGGYIQAIGTLLILLAVLYGVVWLVRKYGRFNFLPKPGAFPRDGLRLESQLPLGPRKGLMVVRFLNKRLLLGVTDHQITLLKETADEDEENNLDFKDVMDKAQRQKSDGEFL